MKMGKDKKYFQRREQTPPTAPAREEVHVEPEIEGKDVYIIQIGCTTKVRGWMYSPGDPIELTRAEAEHLGKRVKLRSDVKAEKNRESRDARFDRVRL